MWSDHNQSAGLERQVNQGFDSHPCDSLIVIEAATLGSSSWFAAVATKYMKSRSKGGNLFPLNQGNCVISPFVALDNRIWSKESKRRRVHSSPASKKPVYKGTCLAGSKTPLKKWSFSSCSPPPPPSSSLSSSSSDFKYYNLW